MAKSSAKVAGPENIAPDLLGLTVDISTLTLDPRNARKHSDRNLLAIVASLEQFGQTKPVVVDADGVVLAGNGTLAAAKQLGWERLAVSRVPLSGAAARAYAIADNRTAELAEWDWAELSEQLDEQVGTFGVEAVAKRGWSSDDFDRLHTDDGHAWAGVVADVERFAGGSTSVVLPMPPPGATAPVGEAAAVFPNRLPPADPSISAPPSRMQLVPLFYSEGEAAELLSLAVGLKEQHAVADLSSLLLLLMRKAAGGASAA